MKTVTFEIWVAVGADGYKACLGSGMSRQAARLIADEVHFPDGCYQLVEVIAKVPLPEEKQFAAAELTMIAKEIKRNPKGATR